MTSYTGRIWVDVGSESYVVDASNPWLWVHVLLGLVLLAAWGVGLAWERRGSR